MGQSLISAVSLPEQQVLYMLASGCRLSISEIASVLECDEDDVAPKMNRLGMLFGLQFAEIPVGVPS